MKPPVPAKTRAGAEQVGQHITAWRKLLGLTADQVAERAGIARSTLHRIESGDTGVSFATFLNVTRVLGQLDRVVTSLDPYESDFGRARADEQLPKRVR